MLQHISTATVPYDKMLAMAKEPKKSKHDKRASQIERRQRLRAWVDSLPEFEVHPGQLRFWRETFYVSMASGIIGHVVDLMWRIVINEPIETWVWQLLPIAALPYSVAGAALLWFVYPLFKAKKIGVFLTYLLGAIAATVIEFIAGVTLIVIHGGHNPHWDYSYAPFNVFGQVCLSNSILFGFISVAFVCFILPWLISRLRRFDIALLNITALIIILVAFATSMILGFRIII